MILPINHVFDWRYTRHSKNVQTEKDVIHENTTIIDYNKKVGDKVTTRNKSAYKYKTPFKGPYGIFQTWTNGTITLQTGELKERINIYRIQYYNNLKIE